MPGGFEATVENREKFQSQAVVFATGKRPRMLGVPGEREYSGKGVSYCSVCDGPLFSGKRVAVVGGGNSALESALDMVKIAEHVDVIAPMGITGDAVLAERLRGAENVTFHDCCTVEEIGGNQFVESLVMKDTKTDERKTLPESGVFVEIGMEPNSDPVKHLLQLNQKNEIPVSCACETSVPGLYAAGDVTDAAEKQILIAAAEGAKAALQAHRYLKRLRPGK